MAAKDRSAPEKTERTNRRKDSADSGSQRDSLKHYLDHAPTETDAKTILAAYNSGQKASEIDWSTFRGDRDE